VTALSPTQPRGTIRVAAFAGNTAAGWNDSFCQQWQLLLTAFLWDPSGFPPPPHTSKPQVLSQEQDFAAAGPCHGNSTTNSVFAPIDKASSQCDSW